MARIVVQGGKREVAGPVMGAVAPTLPDRYALDLAWSVLAGHDYDWRAKSEAVRTILGRQTTPELVQEEEELLKLRQSEELGTRVAAAALLQRLNHSATEILAILLSTLRKEDPVQREEAVRMLAVFEGEDALGGLREAAADSSTQVRLAAVTALARQQSEGARRTLEFLTHDESPRVSESARRALRP